MILIAESGSTKTNWLNDKKELAQTIGLNPLFHNSEFIFNELMKHPQLVKDKEQYNKIFFYGASCSSPDRKRTVETALKNFFTTADEVVVEHDLKAAAVATYDGRKGIACILGTGSNSCLYDGDTIEQGVPALGYVLGDEGGGAYFGKKLLSLFLYNKLPAATHKILSEKYGLTKEIIIETVYQKPGANVYLASFARVMDESPDTEFMQQLAAEGFDEFFEYHVCCYKSYKLYPVHFVGSIAYHFKDALKKVADKYNCELGNIDREPVYRLLEWHLNHNK